MISVESSIPGALEVGGSVLGTVVTGDFVIGVFVVGATEVVSVVEASKFGSSVVPPVTFPTPACGVISGCEVRGTVVGDLVDGVIFLAVVVVGDAVTGEVGDFVVVALEVGTLVAGGVIFGDAVTVLDGNLVVVALEGGAVVDGALEVGRLGV